MVVLPLASELKLARSQAGLTQVELSRLSAVSQSVIAKIENGKVDPAYSTVQKLFSALDKTAKDVKLVREVMHSPPVLVNFSDPISSASAKMKKLGVSQLPVVSANRLVGLVSEEDILRAIETGVDVKNVRVGKIASPSPPVLSDSAPASALSAILRHSPIVCIVRSNKLVGVVTRADLLTVF